MHGGSADDPIVGRRISHFRVEQKLGEGGMGAVYLAQDEALDRRVALKAIRHDRQGSAETRARFQREARVLSRLDHPGICRIYEYISGEDEDFLVLELIAGRTLAQAEREGLGRGAVLRIAEEIVAALGAAHAQGIVHRDLKPTNVMLTEEGRVKVLDFGLARTTSGSSEVPGEPPTLQSDSSTWSDTGTLTEAGTVSGTLRYMSPEQANALPLTTASDLYSFGLLFQELLSHERAYPAGLSVLELWELAKQGRSLTLRCGDRELDALVASLKSAIVVERPNAAAVGATLARVRSRPRRRLMLALAGAGLLVVAAGVTKYVVDLNREHSAALAARSESDRRRDAAEELLGFLVGDLREKLEPIGRLDILDDVGARAQAYFDSLPEALQSDEERLRKSEILYQIGELRRLQGDLPAARVLYQAALESASSLAERAGDNLEWLLALGASQFYVGLGMFEDGDFAGAQEWWQAYLETSARGLELSAGDLTWRQEVAMAHNNLGAVARKLGDTRAKLEHFEESLERWREMLREHPGDAQLELGLADALSWLGAAHFEAGAPDAPAALALFEEERQLRLDLLAEDPRDTGQQSQLATVETYLGQASNLDGSPEDALRYLESAVERSRALVRHDQDNTEWRAELARQQKLLGQAFARLGQPEHALDQLLEAEDLFTELSRLDPTRAAWQTEAASAKRERMQVEAGEAPLD